MTATYPVKADEIIYSPDGKFFLVKACKELTLFEESGEKKWATSMANKINAVKFDGKSKTIYMTTKKGIFVGETLKGSFALFTKEPKVQHISTSPNKPVFATSEGKTLIIGNQKTGDILKRIKKAHRKKIIFLDFISEKGLLSIGSDSVIKIWDTNKGREIISYKLHPYRIHAASLSLDKRILVLGTYDFKFDVRLDRRKDLALKEKIKIVMIDVKKLTIVKEMEGATDYIASLSISADKKFAAVLKDDKTIDIWDLENGYIIRSFSEQNYHDIKFGPRGKTLLMAIKAGQIQRWDTKRIVAASPRSRYMREKFVIKTSSKPLIKKKKNSDITIAVLDFSGSVIEPQIQESISSYFRDRLLSFPYIKIAARDRINNVLNEQGLQHSSVTSVEKAAQIGKLLNVRKLTMGKLHRIKSTLVVSITVVDVKNAKIEGRREIKWQNYALENLPEMIDRMFKILIEK
jgi:WD40 repeat protein